MKKLLNFSSFIRTCKKRIKDLGLSIIIKARKNGTKAPMKQLKVNQKDASFM
jgi:hypothetical protein